VFDDTAGEGGPDTRERLQLNACGPVHVDGRRGASCDQLGRCRVRVDVERPGGRGDGLRLGFVWRQEGIGGEGWGSLLPDFLNDDAGQKESNQAGDGQRFAPGDGEALLETIQPEHETGESGSGAVRIRKTHPTDESNLELRVLSRAGDQPNQRMAQRDIVRTEAIVLRNLNYGETSQIVTLFTRERGKVSVMAKGARKTKSKFGSTLQPMAYTQVVFYYKPTRTLQLVSESSHVVAFHDLQRSLEKITLGLRIVELVAALMEEENPQPAIFRLIVRVLRHLDAADERAANLWPFVQLRMASLMGVAPAVRRENVESVGSGGLLSLANGGVYPSDATPEAAQQASRAALRAYAVFVRADIDTVLRMHLTDAVRAEVEDLVESFMRYHFEDAYPDRTREVAAQLFLQRPRSSAPGGRSDA